MASLSTNGGRGLARELAEAAEIPDTWLDRRVRRLPLWPARVPILAYHRIHPSRAPFAVTPERFASHMRLLRRYYHPVPLSRVVGHLHRGDRLPPRAVAVTFDDGYRDNYAYAYPILAAFGVPATFFVATAAIVEGGWFWWDRVRHSLREVAEVAAAWPELAETLRDQPRELQVARVIEALKGISPESRAERLESLCTASLPEVRQVMTWSELAEMVAHGMEVGAHSVTHSVMARQAVADAAREILDSKATIEEALGLEVRMFAYPYGRPAHVPPQVRRLVALSGFDAACSAAQGFATRRSDPFMLPRIVVPGDLAVGSLLLRLAGVLRYG